MKKIKDITWMIERKNYFRKQDLKIAFTPELTLHIVKYQSSKQYFFNMQFLFWRITLIKVIEYFPKNK